MRVCLVKAVTKWLYKYNLKWFEDHWHWHTNNKNNKKKKKNLTNRQPIQAFQQTNFGKTEGQQLVLGAI